METAVDVLPHDIDLIPFLQSPQLQMAWFSQLTISKGDHEAKLFKELIVRYGFKRNVNSNNFWS